MKDETPTTSPRLAWTLGILHFLFGIFLIYVVVQVWPASTTAKDLAKPWTLFGQATKMNSGQRVLFLVIVVGMTGSFVQSSNSFISYAGNRALTPQWIWYYLLRPLIAAVLAIGRIAFRQCNRRLD